MNASPMFGRRRTEDLTPAARPANAPPAAAAPPPPLPQSAPQPTYTSSSTTDSLAELRTLALQQLDPAAAAALPQDRLLPEIEKLVADIATERRIQLNAREQRQLANELVNDMLGLGPLQPLLDDESIADIMVNGPERVFVERQGRVTLSNVKFRDAQHVANICQRIASAIGRRIDESSPMVDARLMDGSRVNIVFPPLALDGPYVSIRKFGKKPIDLAKLVEFGALSKTVASALEIASRCRLNMIISGGTESGKATMMNALSRFIELDERVLTVEDAAELQLQQPHVVRLETRPNSLEGKGEVNQRELVRNALRMRPDRIIIGEVRGGEAFDMLQAMNTGHDGSMSTIHANNTRDALVRVENMVQMGHMGLPSQAIRTQIVGAVDLIIQVARQRDGGRRVTQVTEICGMEGDVIAINDIFALELQGQDRDGRLFGSYKRSRVAPRFAPRLAYFGLDKAWQEVMME